MISRNYTEFIKFMPLTLIKSMGDKQAIIDNMKKGDQKMISDGFMWDKVIVGEPGEIVDTANTLQCLVPQTLLINTPQKSQIINHSYTLAVSWDKGVTWLFAGINSRDVSVLKRVYPVLSDKMTPPESKTEVID